MDLADFAVLLVIAYFAVFGLGFLLRPELVDRFALRWTDPAGRTEVRCYYGAVSLALAAFMGLLLAEDQSVLALTGTLFLAAAVLTVRIVGTLVDGGRDHPYTRTAIPAEVGMVVALVVVRVLV